MFAGERRRLPNGTVITAEKREPHWGPKPGSTAKHEAAHAVVGAKAGAKLIRASRIPQGPALGFTEFDRYSGPGAAAAKALGHGGTGHDENIIKHMGGNIGAEIQTAKNIAAGAKEHLDAVGRVIQRDGEVDGETLHQVIEEVDKGPELVMKIFFPNGTMREYTKRDAKRTNKISIPESELPPAKENRNNVEKIADFKKKKEARENNTDFIPASELPRVA